jgi:CheY-like chemotaxis protein
VTPAAPSAAQAARSVVEVNDLTRQIGCRAMYPAVAIGDCVTKPIRVEELVQALERSTERRHV